MLMSAVKALARRFELPAQAESAVERREVRRRGLRVGNLNLLVPHDSGGELMEESQIHPLPRTASWCRGLINLRGQLVPAFDLHEYLGLRRLRASREWWLVLGRGDTAIAFALDALPVMLQATTPAVIQPAVVPDSLRAFIDSGFRIDGELWLEFAYRDFFTTLAQRVAA